MIDGLHIGPDDHSRGLPVDRLAPKHSIRAIGFKPAHEGVVLSGPGVPPVRKIHLRPPGTLLLTRDPLKNPVTLQLDSQGIGEIDHPFAAVLDGVYRQIAFGRIIHAGGAALSTSAHAIYPEAPLRAGAAHAPVEIDQAIILEELRGARVVASRHPSVEAAVVVRYPFRVVQIDRPPLLQQYVVRDGDQVRLMLHGAERVWIEVDEQFLSVKALAG